MRHSTLELTGRYTRPRAVDIEKAAESLPSLRPDAGRPNASTLAATAYGWTTHKQSLCRIFAELRGRIGAESVAS